MFKKLLKYDLRYVYKILGIYYILAPLCIIIGNLLNPFSEHNLIKFISEFCRSAGLGLSIGLIINAVTRTWLRFHTNLYKDEAYLTHTLPVKRSTMFTSKFVSSLIILACSLIICIINILLFMAPYSSIDYSLIFSLEPIPGTHIIAPFAILLVLYQIFAQSALILNCGFTGILAGHRFNNHRPVLAVLIGASTYLIFTLIILGLGLLAGLINPDFYDIVFLGHINNPDPFIAFIGLASIIYTACVAITFFINQRILARGVDAD